MSYPELFRKKVLSGQAGFAGYSQLAPLNPQYRGIDHLIINDNGSKPSLEVCLLIFLDDVLSTANLLGCRRIGFVDDIDLGRVYSPLTIKTHACTHLGITAACFVITNSQGYTIDNSDSGCSGCGNTFGFGIIIVKKLFASHFLSTNITCEIDQAKDQPSHTRRRLGNLLCMQDGIRRLDQNL